MQVFLWPILSGTIFIWGNPLLLSLHLMRLLRWKPFSFVSSWLPNFFLLFFSFSLSLPCSFCCSAWRWMPFMRVEKAISSWTKISVYKKNWCNKYCEVSLWDTILKMWSAGFFFKLGVVMELVFKRARSEFLRFFVQSLRRWRAAWKRPWFLHNKY